MQFNICRRIRRARAAVGRFPAILLLVLVAALAGPQRAAADNSEVWQALRAGGHVALLRHALAPGTGDPDDFEVSDCRTQRNLSEEGRAQARSIGARLKAKGVASPRVYSSQWCRCLDTARLLDLGPVQELPLLNSFFSEFERRDIQTEGLKRWLANLGSDDVAVLVTHQVNITALTGVFPASGELVVIRPFADGSIDVVGTVETDAR